MTAYKLAEADDQHGQYGKSESIDQSPLTSARPCELALYPAPSQREICKVAKLKLNSGANNCNRMPWISYQDDL